MSGRRRRRSSRPQRPSLRAQEVAAAASQRRRERQQLLRQREARQRELQQRRQQRALEQQLQENKTQEIQLDQQLQQAEFNSQYNTAREMLRKMSSVEQRQIPDADDLSHAREYAQLYGMPIVRALPPPPHQPFFFDPETNAATYIDPLDVQVHEVYQALGPARPPPSGPSIVHAFDSDSDAEMGATEGKGGGSDDDDDVGDADAQQLCSGSRPASPGLLGALALGDEGGGGFSFEDLEDDPVIGAGRGGRRKRRKKKTRRKRRRKRRRTRRHGH